MNTNEVLDILNDLPLYKKLEVFNFIIFISKYTLKKSIKKRLNLRNEPAFGLWVNRDEMNDSTAWVRRLREREWEQQK